MALHEIHSLQTSPEIAADFIAHLNHQTSPTDHEQWMLATAHFTLAKQKETSLCHSKMHVNSAITFLQNIKIRNPDWGGTLAEVYFNRAELFEQEFSFSCAAMDYQRAIKILEDEQSPSRKEASKSTKSINSTKSTQDKLLIARCAISIADLFLNTELNVPENTIYHPLYYANKALEYMSQISEYDEDACLTLAYAHQIAGITMTPVNFEAAKIAFQSALEMAFRSEETHACRIISEIYYYQALLHEHVYYNCPIKVAPPFLLDYSSFYYGLWILFSPHIAYESEEPESLALDTFFDLFYTVLDPYSSVLTQQMQRDFIDATIYAYSCVVNKTLPNQTLCEELNDPDALKTFAQHIHWVLSETYHRDNFEGRLLDAATMDEVECAIDFSHLLSKLEDGREKRKVVELKARKNRAC